MNVKELIEHLSKFNKNAEVMILDGFNGQGNKRTINWTPSSLRAITKIDAKESGDCEDKIGKKVVMIGFGCY
jgi:hypothetical protein